MSSWLVPPSQSVYGSNSSGKSIGVAVTDTIAVAGGGLSTLNDTGPPLIKAARLVGEVSEARRYYSVLPNGTTQVTAGQFIANPGADGSIPAPFGADDTLGNPGWLGLPSDYKTGKGNSYIAVAFGPDQPSGVNYSPGPVYGLTAKSEMTVMAQDGQTTTTFNSVVTSPVQFPPVSTPIGSAIQPGQWYPGLAALGPNPTNMVSGESWCPPQQAASPPNPVVLADNVEIPPGTLGKWQVAPYTPAGPDPIAIGAIGSAHVVSFRSAATTPMYFGEYIAEGQTPAYGYTQVWLVPANNGISWSITNPGM